MDAIDVAWCLGCNRHIDGAAAYCSPRCHDEHAAISSKPQPARYQTPPPLPQQPFGFADGSLSADDLDDLEDDPIQLSLDHTHEFIHTPTKASWVGKGVAGIQAWARDIPPGPPSEADVKPSTSPHAFRPPKLILSQKRPIPPTLCMSKTLPAPPEPSRPILTPQQSLPSVSSQHSATDASLTSLTTALSSLSLATPASPISDAADYSDPPSAETQKPLTLMGNLTAHLRSWAASSHHNTNGKAKVRSTTVTRLSQEPAVAGLEATRPYYRPRSPVSFFPTPDHLITFPAEKPRSLAEKEYADDLAPSFFSHSHLHRPQQQQHRLDDHPAFRLRGRKAAKFVS